MNRRVYLATVAALVVTIAIAATLVVVARHHSSASAATSLRLSGLPSVVTTSEANAMTLSPVPARPAPGFTLVDQTGRTFSLAQFRGHPVVINFMDSHCTDICPLVAAELVDAEHDLGAAAKGTVFLAVNVNPYHRAVADVAAFSAGHGLDTIATWHFLTGPLATLRSIWRAYGVDVVARGYNADVIHSSITYFLDPRGRERYVASPVVDHTKSGTSYLPPNVLATWGRGIAHVADSLAS